MFDYIHVRIEVGKKKSKSEHYNSISFQPQSNLNKILFKKDVTKRRNGEWGMGNGEWGMGNGEWGMGNGEWGIMVSGNI